ncbi:myocardin isoform X2 [Ascaphus truei]|uniref:myocardin isoform X2 n=1 Tax=Ascaphus truei TaxID=8439 RepID=UPI003F598AC2
MTLLGSEHSLLIRSKFRSALKSPAAFHEQRKNLDRAKTEDYLKHKVRNRPEKSDLINMHILQDSAAEGSDQAAQMKLKRARLADDLNEKIALRPGPLELVEKNIIPLESTLKETLAGDPVTFSKPVDAFAFEEDSSNDDLSPEQARNEDSLGPASASPQEAQSFTGSPTSGSAQNRSHGSDNEAKDVSSAPNPSCSLHTESQLSPNVPVPGAVKCKSSADTKNRHKKPKDIKPKVKKLKYHQYIPPDQKAEKSPPPMDSAYARLLQQQQLFLQLQILSQQQQQHYSYQGMHHPQLKQPCEQMGRNSSQTAAHSPSLSPVKTTFSGQANISSMKLGPLPSNLDDLKVSELRQQLRIRGLPVSGTKTSLMERLRPFQDCGGNAVPTFGEMTTVTFPVTPNNALSGYQTHPSTGMLSNGFYQFGSTSSTPPISPASSDLSVSGSLPDTFSDGPMSSPFGLHPSPVHLSADESLISSINSSSYQAELEGIDAEKDKMLVEKQKVINELTWKLQQEQRQVEELRMQLQKRKGSCGVQDKQLPSQLFFGVPIKQENVVSSCPFATKQVALKTQTSNPTEKLGPCGAQSMSCLVNSHCMESSSQNSIISSTFLSPQCSPQHSPLGTANSPQHISLPPSPNNHYLLPVSPHSQGDGRSVSPHNNRLRTSQNTGNPVGFSPTQNNLQSSFIDQSESKESIQDGAQPKSPNIHSKVTFIQPTPQTGQKFSVPCPNFSNATSTVSKQPPSYEDAVKQQITRSQQMDELLDVLIESGEMPANAKEERPCVQKLHPMSVPPGNSNAPTSNAHLPYDHCSNNDSHLEVLLNSHSPMGAPGEMALLKIGNEESNYEGVMDGFPGKATKEHLPSQEILDTALSAMETQMSPSSSESTALQHLSFTESPWETMEWLDLTPPSSASGLGSLTTTGPSIFNTDFLDVTDLNLNTAMDLHLEQW